MGYPKGAAARRNGKNFATLAQYFAMGKADRRGNCYGREWEPGVQGAETGSSDPPVPPPLPCYAPGRDCSHLFSDYTS